MRLSQPEQVAATIGPVMDGFGAPWCVAGGWALDLWLARRTRVHADVEVAVFRQDQALLHTHFPCWAFIARVDGRSEPWHPGDTLSLPVHEIHARSPDEQTLEFLLNERDDMNWSFRRDVRIVRRLEEAIVSTEYGVDVLAPEIILLFKAKSPRDKDEADFHAALAALSHQQRLWLRSALLVCDPQHRWLDALRT